LKCLRFDWEGVRPIPSLAEIISRFLCLTFSAVAISGLDVGPGQVHDALDHFGVRHSIVGVVSTNDCAGKKAVGEIATSGRNVVSIGIISVSRLSSALASLVSASLVLVSLASVLLALDH